MTDLQGAAVRNAFTVDVEDYFHVEAFANVIKPEDWDHYPQRVEGNTMRILDILGKYGVKGTFFVLGWVAERVPGLVKRIAGEGHEVACHGYSHQPLSRMTPDEFRQDLRKSKEILEGISGCSVKGYRAPTFSITPGREWAFTILAEEGLLYDSSVFPIRHDNYGWPDFPRHAVKRKEGIVEIPMSTVRVLGINLPFSGGGYLRIFPLSFIKACYRHVNLSEGKPAILYIHPWEVDPDQPRIPARRLSAFRHYTNLRGMEARLRSLLRDLSFGRLDEMVARMAVTA